VLFFGFQNSLCRAIQSRFYQVKAFLNRTKETKLLSTQLPKGLHHRLDSLIARDIAALPWQTKTAIAIPPSVTHKIKALHPHLADTTRPLAISIGHVVPRDPQFTSIGDACGIGGGLSAMNCISGLMFCGRLTLEMRSMSEASTSIYSNLWLSSSNWRPLLSLERRKRFRFVQCRPFQSFKYKPTICRPVIGPSSVSSIITWPTPCKPMCCLTQTHQTNYCLQPRCRR
jgi:hypothetical protein